MTAWRDLDARVVFGVPALYALIVVVELVIILSRHDALFKEALLGMQTKVLQHGITNLEEAHALNEGLSWGVWCVSVDCKRGRGRAK
jgi:hypothetical protein